MPFASTLHRRAGAVAFVLAAVAATVGVAFLLAPHDGAEPKGQLLPIGPQPSAQRSPVLQRGVYGTKASPQQVAEDSSTLDMVPLSPRDFAAPIAAYRVYAGKQVGTFATDVRALTAALRAGDRGTARAAWQRADSTFARIGAAYGALGPLGDAIDGGPGGLPKGTADPRFTGLRRIELGLWSGTSPRSLAPYGDRLERDAARLRRTLRSAPIDAVTYATRAHEILEDVQRDRLSSPTPSDSGVRATADGVAATRVVLGTLEQLLQGRGDAQTQAESALLRLSATLAAIRRAHDGYPSGSALTLAERQRLAGRLGAALGALSGIPGALETTRPPEFATRTP